MQAERNQKKFLGTGFDTIASHSHHVAVIAYCLARMEGLSHEEGLKCVAMGVFHDLAEARTGDYGFVGKHYGQPDEEKAVDDQFRDLPFGDDLHKVVDEYEERQSLAAKCAKDADSLEQLYLEWVLMWQGNKMAQRWFKSDFIDRVPALKTESAKKIAMEMKESDPQDWWWTEFLEDEAAKDVSKLVGNK